MIKWLDNKLIVGPFFCLCLNKQKHAEVMKSLKITEAEVKPFMHTRGIALVQEFIGRYNNTCVLSPLTVQCHHARAADHPGGLRHRGYRNNRRNR